MRESGEDWRGLVKIGVGCHKDKNNGKKDKKKVKKKGVLGGNIKEYKHLNREVEKERVGGKAKE